MRIPTEEVLDGVPQERVTRSITDFLYYSRKKRILVVMTRNGSVYQIRAERRVRTRRFRPLEEDSSLSFGGESNFLPD